jgi:hypothetical protein
MAMDLADQPAERSSTRATRASKQRHERLLCADAAQRIGGVDRRPPLRQPIRPGHAVHHDLREKRHDLAAAPYHLVDRLAREPVLLAEEEVYELLVGKAPQALSALIFKSSV